MIYWFINLFCLYQYALAETEIQSQQGTESAWKALYIIFNYYNSVCYSLYYGNPATIEYDAAQGRMMIMISSFYFIFYFLDYTYFCFADEFIKIMTTIADESGVFLLLLLILLVWCIYCDIDCSMKCFCNASMALHAMKG